MKLFGFGNKSEKRTAVVLGEHLAELFGAEQGAELIVEATESGREAIDAAESRLAEFNTQISQIDQLIADKAAAEKAKSIAVAALAAEQEAHKGTKDAFDAFKKAPGAEHSHVQKEEDTVNSPSTRELKPHEKKEQEVRERAGAGAKKQEPKKD